MPSYTYSALDRNGKKIKSTMDSPTVEAAKSSLRAMGCTVLDISETNALNRDIEVSFLGNPKSKDLAVFCRQFVSILRAGIPITSVLGMLAAQTENKKLTSAIRGMQADIEKGMSLAAAMGKYPRIFPKMLTNMIASGEASGNLEESFLQMEVYYDKLTKTKSKVGRVMIYPAVLVVVMIAVLIVMMTKIIPKFLETFESMDMDLPKITKTVMNVSEWFVEWWWLFILIIAGIAVICTLFNRTNAGRHFFGKIALKLPVLGKFIRNSSSATFCRTLSILLASGVSLVESLDIVADNMSNIWFSDAAQKAKRLVSEGWTLNLALQDSGLFPPMVVNLAGIGEETGELQEMLAKTADFYDQEVDDSTAKLLSLLEPVIILIMAFFVIVIVFSIFLPMLNMTQAYDQYLQ